MDPKEIIAMPFIVEIPLGEKHQDRTAIEAELKPKIDKLNEGKNSYEKITYESTVAMAIAQAEKRHWENYEKKTMYRTETPKKGESVVETYHFKTEKEAKDFCLVLDEYKIKHKEPIKDTSVDSKGPQQAYIPSLSAALKSLNSQKK